MDRQTDTDSGTETRTVCANVPEELAQEFEARARAEDRTVSAQLRRLMREYVERKQAA